MKTPLRTVFIRLLAIWRRAHPVQRALAMAGSALVSASIALFVAGAGGDHTTVAEKSQAVQTILPALSALPPVEMPRTAPEKTSAPDVFRAPLQHLVQVQAGDNLARIFTRLGLSPQSLHRVMEADGASARLRHLLPGDRLKFTVAAQDNQLIDLLFKIDEATDMRIFADQGRFTAKAIQHNIEIRPRHAFALIHSSLFVAGRKAGIRDGLIMDLAGIFGWDIDFVLDIRPGDYFSVIYEQVFRDGKYLRDGAILAARFVNQGHAYTAVRYREAHAGSDFFTPDGKNMRKAFLRAPLNFSYISSGFNPHRLHPVLKRVRPHNGIDYRAPRGTAVYAAGDGTVIRSAYSRLNGNYVFIKHGNHIVTKYLHFSKRLVKRGQRVKQGQVIGRVGSTGRTTGAHLHYEFVVNGVHRNPRTVKLPDAPSLPKAELHAFHQAVDPWLGQLNLLHAIAVTRQRFASPFTNDRQG